MIDKETGEVSDRGFLIARMIPINKNHTRTIFRTYIKFPKIMSYLPLINDASI